MSPALLAVLLLAGADRFGAIFDAADRVAVVRQDFVTEPGARHSTQVERVLYDSSAAADVAALRDALAAAPQDGVCGCIASIEIHLYRGNERLATAAYLGRTMRGDLWGGDVSLVDHEALLRWFDARGVDEPRKDALADEARRRAFDRAEALWLAAMPASLRPAFQEIRRYDPTAAVPPAWRVALEAEYPDVVDRAAALLRWYGYGGPWDGAASFEEGPEEWLEELPIATLAAAVEANAADGAVLEGGARFFARRPSGDTRGLSSHLRGLLLEHVREGGDAAKRDRAEKALGDRR
jgi:hypothetical protein